MCQLVVSGQLQYSISKYIKIMVLKDWLTRVLPKQFLILIKLMFIKIF